MVEDLHHWLHRHGLGHLEGVLSQAGVGLDILGDLTESDLTELGFSLGDRKRLLKAVAAHPPEQPAPVSEAQAVSHPRSPVRAETVASTAPAGLPEAQRRQVTVMFCDLVGSTGLSTQMDPEDLRELIGQYHQHASREIKRAGGFVAKFMGDGVLAYFGYPQASENDAERAARAGLAVVQGMPALGAAGRGDLQVRVGIATGTVVVGDLVVEGTAPERAVVGETPNLAARLQSLADPGQVLIGVSTRRLLGELFELKDLGALSVKGFADPVLAWQVLGERAAASRFEAQRAGALSRFVGRDSEVAMLRERWELAAEGEGQVVLVTGEAGIGKSRITAALRQWVMQADGAAPPQTLLWQCSPVHSGTPLHPVIQQLQYLNRESEGLEALLQAAGLPEAGRRWVLRLSGVVPQQATGLDPSVEKANTLYALVEAVQVLTSRQPVLLLVEDAHWVDPSTEELLALAVQQLRMYRVMLVVTARPGYEPSWQQAPNLTRLALSRLAQRQCLQLAREVAQEVARGLVEHWSLPAALLEQIVQRTDGVPLFVEELTRAVLEAGLPQELQQGWPATGQQASLAIPATLQDSLTARLDRLQPATREVAQAASVIGRDFSQALLREVVKPMGEPQVAAALLELQRADLVYLRQGAQPAGSFKHALVRDASYGSLLKAQRAQWHAKVARALEAVEPELALQQPEVLAGHWQKAGELNQAFELWCKAGDLAFSRSSLVEAAEHYRSAAALCASVNPPAATELDLQLSWASVLTQTEGYGSAASLAAARQAYSLSGRPELRSQRIAAVRALATSLVSRGAVLEAMRCAEESLDADLALAGNQDFRASSSDLWILGTTAQVAGRCVDAQARLQQCLDSLKNSAEETSASWGGALPTVAVLLWLDRTLLYRGLLAQGRQMNEEALAISRRSGHPPSVTWALLGMINWLNLQSRYQEAEDLAREGMELSQRFHIKPRVAGFRIIQGRGMVAAGKVREGAALMRSGVDLWLEHSSVMTATLMITTPASAMAAVGDVRAVQEYLEMGERLMRDTEERIGQAELLRLRAWVCRHTGDLIGAQKALEDALTVAERQGARYFALRAAIDLVKWSDGGQYEAAALADLKRVYEGFTEGFGFPVLIGARRLLESRGVLIPLQPS